TTFWPDARSSGQPAPASPSERASRLCQDHWQDWTEWLRQRVAGSPLRRWLGTHHCRWGYRRGFVAVFQGTQSVLRDAWDDLFRLGPVEEVQIHNLWHFGTVCSLRQFLDQPSLRVLRLGAEELRPDDVAQLQQVSD